jgi:hypothetical protein
MYSWQIDYIAALLETDETKLHRRLYEAVSAIEQRLLTPVEAGGSEEQALKQAQKVIGVIREQHPRSGDNPAPGDS